MKKKTTPVGTIKPEDIKVRKKGAPPTQVQKSSKDYNRKRLKQNTRKAKTQFGYHLIEITARDSS
ncbi:MAG: hypothetical protein ACE5DZ_05700 [Mariprofundus sp.]